jgi:protein-L-isoaspartate O-methyltransferase
MTNQPDRSPSDSGSEAEPRYTVAAFGLDRQRRLAAMLGMVDVPEGARILELDTDADFGYTALQLARASLGGSVISVSEFERITDRARRVHQFRARDVSGFHTGPLAAGWPSDAPYDLVISHHPFGWLPQDWLTQCVAGAAILTPLDHSRPETRLYLRVYVNDQHEPTQGLLLVELEDHPHCTRYGTTPDVTLQPDAKGYSITANITEIAIPVTYPLNLTILHPVDRDPDGPSDGGDKI